LLDAFVAAGFNLIDTADVYSRFAPGNRGAESKTVIGKWLKQGGRCDKVIMATKVGLETSARERFVERLHNIRGRRFVGRLQTDCIDLYQSHREDRDTALDETLHAYAHLMEQGNVRAIGASNYSAERLSYDWRWAEATNCQGMSASRPNIIFTIAGSTRKYSNPFA